MTLRFFSALAALFFLSLPAQALEQIHHFDVEANLSSDGWLDVHERISVSAEGQSIKHGIYRDFPTIYRDALGNAVRISFELLDLTRDHTAELYHVENRSNGKRIYIGNPHAFVPQGRHEYELHYRVNRVVGFFDGYDELYWNVTGNGWVFPIKAASFHLTLPPDASIMHFDGYTGPQGAKGKAYKGRERGNELNAITTAPLNPYEGFTVAVAFDKGIIAPVSLFQRVMDFLRDNIAWFAAAVFALLITIYHTVAWHMAGRDIKPGPVVPLFSPPKNISATLMRYVRNEAYDMKMISVALVEMATAGNAVLDEDDEEFTAERTRDGVNDRPEIEDAMGVLFLEGKFRFPKPRFFSLASGDIEERRARSSTILSARGLQIDALSQRKPDYFFTNTSIKLIGWGLSALAVFIAGGLADSDQMRFLVGGSVTLYLFGLNALFHKLHNWYTPEGRTLVDQSEGLRMYLRTAEEDRMNTLYPKNITPETFEALLPYAMALDVEQEWCNSFAAQLARAATPPEENYSPRWYRRRRKRFEIGNFGQILTSGLSDAISSASTPPGSKSGSFGRGSSGGGGGGGGGGGW